MKRFISSRRMRLFLFFCSRYSSLPWLVKTTSGMDKCPLVSTRLHALHLKRIKGSFWLWGTGHCQLHEIDISICIYDLCRLFRFFTRSRHIQMFVSSQVMTVVEVYKLCTNSSCYMQKISQAQRCGQISGEIRFCFSVETNYRTVCCQVITYVNWRPPRTVS